MVPRASANTSTDHEHIATAKHQQQSAQPEEHQDAIAHKAKQRKTQHLTPRKHVANESSNDHQQEEDDPRASHPLPWPTVAAIIQASEHVKIHHSKEEGSTIGMTVPDQPTLLHVSHHMLHT